MNAPQTERPEDEANAAPTAGFFTRWRRKKPVSTEYERVTPFLDPDFVSPAVDATAQESSEGEVAGANLYQELRSTVSAAWNQPDLDDSVFEAVKDFEILVPYDADKNQPLVMCDPVDKCPIQMGIKEDGAHFVIGPANITASMALSRAQAAMTCDLMREDGIEEVLGTDMDKALLWLAARHVGLRINNEPELPFEVMRDAKALWDKTLAEKNAAPVAGATATEPAPADVTDVQTAPVDDGIPTLPLSDVITADSELEPTTAEEKLLVKAISDLKPEVRTALQGDTPEGSVSLSTYLEVRDMLRAGKGDLTDGLGFIKPSNMCEQFRLNADHVDKVIEALKADSLVYNAKRVTEAPRTLINYQVDSPVLHEAVAHPFAEDHKGTRFKTDMRPRVG